MANSEKVTAKLEKTTAEPEQIAGKLDQTRVELDKGAARLDQARAQLEKGRAELDQARAELDQARADLEDGAAGLEKTAAEPKKVAGELEQARAKLEEKAAELDQVQTKLEEKAAGLDQSEAELNQARAKLDQMQAELEHTQRRIRMAKINIIFGFVVAQLYVWLTFFATTKKSGFPYNVLGLAIIIFVICWVVGWVLPIALRSRGFTTWLGVALINAFLYLVATFAGLYYHYGTATNFTGPIITRVDALYFTLGTITTAGTGNISADSQLTRGLVSIQMCVDLIFVTFIIAIAVTRLSERRRSN